MGKHRHRLPTPNNPQQLVKMQAQSTRFQGPIPPPEILRQYAEVVPELPRIIVGEYQKQSAHRQKLESQLLESNIRKETRGQWISFAFGGATLIGGFLLIHEGREAWGVGLMVGDLLAFAAVFITREADSTRGA